MNTASCEKEAPSLSRDEAIAILDTPDEELEALIDRASSLRYKYKGNRVSIHILTNARSGNCSQDCAYCAQSCRSTADIDKYKWVDEDKLYQGFSCLLKMQSTSSAPKQREQEMQRAGSVSPDFQRFGRSGWRR